MTIEFSCPQAGCGRRLRTPAELAGQWVKCPGCGSAIGVPVPAHVPVAGSAVPQARIVAPAEDPLVGAAIAHFEVLEKLGQGGMGAVYKARNIKLNRMVALKVVSDSVKDKDPTFLDRFMREAQLAAQIDHPNLVTVYSVDSGAGYHFIEMQYVEGMTLRKMVDGGTADVGEVTRIICEAARGLAAAYEKGILHRDVKPENIMIDKSGQVMVSDFGLAKLEDASTGLTLSGHIMGTPLYLSPEQAVGAVLDARSDIYSLGATFYHAVTRQTPFMSDSIAGLVYQHVHAPPPYATAVNPSVSSSTSAVIQKMMAKNPGERYQSYRELLADLQVLLAPGQLSPSTISKAEELKRVIRHRATKSRDGLVAVVGVAAGILVLGVIVMSLVKSREAGTSVRKSEPRQAVATEPAESAKKTTDPKADSASAAPAPKAQSAPAPATPKEPTEPAAKQEQIAVKEPAQTQAAVEHVEPAPTPAEKTHPKVKGLAAVDLVRYSADVKPIDERIEAYDYDAARSRAHLLKGKYPELIETKLANVDRIIALRKKCFDRVNSGEVKLAMGDVSRKYAFAGDIAVVDGEGVTGKIKKKWDSFAREEVTEFYRRVSDPKSADDLMALAALLMEGTADEKRLDAALDPLGKAARMGADVTALVGYVEALRRTRSECAEVAQRKGPEQAERKGTEVEKKEGKDTVRKEEADVDTAKSETKKAGAPKAPTGSSSKKQTDDETASMKSAESKVFRIAVKHGEMLDSVNVDDNSAWFVDLAKTVKAQGGRKFLKVVVALDLLQAKPVSIPYESRLVPGCVVKWDWISVKDGKKHISKCIYVGSTYDNTLEMPKFGRESTFVKENENRVSMIRYVEGHTSYAFADDLSLLFVVKEDSGPFKLSFADVEPIEIVMQGQEKD